MRFALLLCAALLLGTAAPAPDTQAAEPYDGPILRRPNLLVADIPTALKVYRDILGFTASGIVPSPPGAVTYDIYKLPPEAKLRFVFLSAGEQGRIIALTEAKGAAMPAARAGFDTSIIIEVQKNLDGIMAALKAEGLDVGEAIPLTDPSGAKRRDVSFTDADGHRIVLYEMEKK
ncbi:MAG: VOC family protein [Rhodospirillaceae bacterium]|nr:VOC family protein [Rhodospirillaceae bacterium]